MKARKISKETTNRGEFNRAYKAHLEHSGKIRCTYCKYHRGENSNEKWYGGYTYDKNDTKYGYKKRIKFPNWKLVSKNRKQWMKKPIKIETKYYHRQSKQYIDITW